MIGMALVTACGTGTRSHAAPTVTPTKHSSLRPGPPPRDPCSLVTQGEAEAVLGQPIEAPNTSLGARICRYQAVSKHQLMLVSISAFTKPIGEVFRAQRATKHFFDHDVPTLGPMAYCSKRQGVLVTVYVVRDEIEVQFVADTCRRAEALASIGVHRI